MKRLISHIQQKPRHVRERIVFLSTLIIIVLLLVVWFLAKSTLQFEAPNENSSNTNSVKPFQLIKQTISGNPTDQNSTESD